MSRKGKIPRRLQKELKKGGQKTPEDFLQSSGSLDVSTIEKASFLQGEQYFSHGNPLHSTALEDECSPEPNSHEKSNRKTNAGKERAGHTGTDTLKAVNSKNHLTRTKHKGDAQQQQKTSRGQTSSPQMHKAPKRQIRHLRTMSESNKGKGRRSAESVLGAAVSEDPTTDESAGAESSQAPLSLEELTDEDESFDPNNEKSKSSGGRLREKQRSSSGHQQRRLKQKRKYSSGSSDRGKPDKKLKRGVRNPTDMDVILEAFQQFVTEYKERVNSETVKQAINMVSCSFEEELSEMITAAKQHSGAKWTALKINRTLNCKKARLLEVKNELIKTESELGKLQKEHGRLEQRLKALTQGTTFLSSLKELNRRYLQHRSAHPQEPETYGPSCLPAMLLEARCIMGTENQLKMINDTMQQFLEETGHN